MERLSYLRRERLRRECCFFRFLDSAGLLAVGVAATRQYQSSNSEDHHLGVEMSCASAFFHIKRTNIAWGFFGETGAKNRWGDLVNHLPLMKMIML